MREEGERGGRKGEEEGGERGEGERGEREGEGEERKTKCTQKIASFLRPLLPHACWEGLGTRLVWRTMHGANVAACAGTCLAVCRYVAHCDGLL